RPQTESGAVHMRSNPAFAAFGGVPALQGGFSLALPRLEDEDLAALLARELGIAARHVVLLAQPHGADILDLEAGAPPTALGHPADGAMARRPSPAVLAIKTADCVPILAADAPHGAYAALHAGWRGAAAGILPGLLARWRQRGSSLAEVALSLGPHIRSCCYAVREDCLSRFAPQHLSGAVTERQGAWHLSLEQVLRNQAQACGLAPGQVQAHPVCTACGDAGPGAPGSADSPYASHRRAVAQGLAAGRNLSWIGWA
ncbi:MAG TPA: polyphenol oxidase family protein, partial [bacterium]|nr:polyphenol oxidase family protein [bacterium]